jgi:hypothetical protein
MTHYNTESLFAATRSALCLATLAGAPKPMAAFKLAGDVLAFCPALFPDFAEALAANPLDPRAACWDIAELMSDEIPGSWDLVKRAREIAAA